MVEKLENKIEKIDLFSKLQNISSSKDKYRAQRTSITLRQDLREGLDKLLLELNSKTEPGRSKFNKLTLSDVFDFLISNLLTAWKESKLKLDAGGKINEFM